MSPPELPGWARWMAVDADGAIWVFEQEPLEYERGWYENEVGRRFKLGQGAPNPDWRGSLERLRPHAFLSCESCRVTGMTRE